MFNESSQYEYKMMEKCTRDDLWVEDVIAGWNMGGGGGGGGLGKLVWDAGEI